MPGPVNVYEWLLPGARMPESGGTDPSGVTLCDWLPTQDQATVSPTLTVVWHTPLA